MNVNHITTVPALEPVTAEAIAQQWKQLGYTEGPPATLRPGIIAIDMRIYSRLTCAACGHGKAKITPYHRGREFRLLCRCKRCGAGMEA